MTWHEDEKTKKVWESGHKDDTNFSTQFLALVRKQYGKNFDFKECFIELYPECNTVTFNKEHGIYRKE